MSIVVCKGFYEQILVFPMGWSGNFCCEISLRKRVASLGMAAGLQAILVGHLVGWRPAVFLLPS